MAGPRDEAVRRPVFAGRFYPADPPSYSLALREYMPAAAAAAAAATDDAPSVAGEGIAGQAAASVSGTLRGAVVPHAGWICSGDVAGAAIATLAAARPAVDVAVVFGAVHTPGPLDFAALDAHEGWAVPGGSVPVATELRRRIGGHPLLAVEDYFHAREHAVEVELPFVRRAWPGASLLPIEVPVIEEAPDVGARVAEAVKAAGLDAVYLASSDLTHYGPAYRFTPAGVGIDALAWAKENDRRLLRVVTDLSVERVVPEAMAHQNACGPGAIAAMMAACRAAGATRGEVLRHVNSYEALAPIAPQDPDNAVGYAAVVIG